MPPSSATANVGISVKITSSVREQIVRAWMLLIRIIRVPAIVPTGLRLLQMIAGSHGIALWISHSHLCVGRAIDSRIIANGTGFQWCL